MIKAKNVYGIRTQDHRILGADESTKLWQPIETFIGWYNLNKKSK